MKTAQSAAESYTSVSSHESAENVSDGATERPRGMSAGREGTLFDLIAHLTEVEGWVRREPGEVIEAGTPIVTVMESGFVTYRGEGYDGEIEVREGEVYTPPPPEPSPLDLIPVGRENAKVLEAKG